jgi:hypothetical protein
LAGDGVIEAAIQPSGRVSEVLSWSCLADFEVFGDLRLNDPRQG